MGGGGIGGVPLDSHDFHWKFSPTLPNQRRISTQSFNSPQSLACDFIALHIAWHHRTCDLVEDMRVAINSKKKIQGLPWMDMWNQNLGPRKIPVKWPIRAKFDPRRDPPWLHHPKSCFKKYGFKPTPKRWCLQPKPTKRNIHSKPRIIENNTENKNKLNCWVPVERVLTHSCSLTTLPETNIAPENWWLGDYFLFGEAYLQGQTVSFGDGIAWYNTYAI